MTLSGVTRRTGVRVTPRCEGAGSLSIEPFGPSRWRLRRPRPLSYVLSIVRTTGARAYNTVPMSEGDDVDADGRTGWRRRGRRARGAPLICTTRLGVEHCAVPRRTAAFERPGSDLARVECWFDAKGNPAPGDVARHARPPACALHGATAARSRARQRARSLSRNPTSMWPTACSNQRTHAVWNRREAWHTVCDYWVLSKRRIRVASQSWMVVK
jgi:hypothetical protein